MKNILYTIILSFLFSFSVFADWEAGMDASVDGDYETAYKEFRAVAEQGDAKAQYSLGNLYNAGRGVTKDYKEAAKWYRLAAEQGHVDAQRNLTSMYINGRGVIKDIVIAHMWINIAASNGFEGSSESRLRIESRMSLEQIAEAEKLARECIKKNYKDCG